MNAIGLDFGTSNTAAMTASMLCNVEKMEFARQVMGA